MIDRRLIHRPLELPTDVVTWRRDVLVRAGFTVAHASTIARESRIDLHDLLQLLDRGCPPELAARIVAPLDP
jgi:hypothetical protein